jgi:serine/threonine protein phosphatase 1
MPRTLIIGDIHGCFAELLDLCEKAGIGEDDVVFSVGDLVDRGPDPSGVVNFFRTRPNSAALVGNHERKHIRGVLSYSQQVARLQLGERYADTVSWFGTLPYFHETPEIRIVHWGLFPGVPLAETPVDVLAGTTSGDAKLRERFGESPWYEHYTDDVPVAFGHAVVGEQPLVLRDRIYGLDTGACHGMRLTGLLLPEFKIVSVPARADHWKVVRSAWQTPVLRTHAWRTMPFDQVAKKVRSLRDPELGDAYLDGVEAWVASLRAAIPGLAVHLDAAVERALAAVGPEEFGRYAATLPVGSWILRHRLGKLSREHLGCTHAEHVFTLAAGLGVDLGIPLEPS